MSRILVSPAERHPALLSLGRVSSIPETYGADFLVTTRVGVVGIQRKAIPDLVASLRDGRISHEMFELKQCDVGVWVIEGEPIFSTAGNLLTVRTTFTLDMYRGVLASLQHHGFRVAHTRDQADTASYIIHLTSWLDKPDHLSLMERPGPVAELGGRLTKRDYQIHMMMGFAGVGYKRARDIVDHYKGLPFSLDPDVDLSDVPGVGKGVVSKIKGVLDD